LVPEADYPEPSALDIFGSSGIPDLSFFVVSVAIDLDYEPSG